MTVPKSQTAGYFIENLSGFQELAPEHRTMIEDHFSSGTTSASQLSAGSARKAPQDGSPSKKAKKGESDVYDLTGVGAHPHQHFIFSQRKLILAD